MLNKVFLSLCVSTFFISVSAQDSTKEVKIPSKEAQVRTALYAAPDDKKEGAMIYGYDQDGGLIVLRPGTNELICLSDNPNKSGISAACYYKELEPFMARGRELTAQGKSTTETREIRSEEIKAGKIKMPEAGMLFVYSAKEEDHNSNTGDITEGDLRYVIYMPFATPESTGISDKPSVAGMPWLMDPGTPRAHIMITPAK
ncbi:hypothetical protein [Cryomorpha ignava]|uniref:hypothetical protein n=1 Tax=Cryomorpha ignava TaxID=101383 RepID=UPI001EF8685F|nr:hypothetical protein [Cryomorpha ignava]